MKTVRETYEGSDGEATKALYARLEALGPVGVVALNLFRAQKCSSRAKEYRRGAWKRDAYDRKNWSLNNLCAALMEHAKGLNIYWGWKLDPAATGPHCWVLYVNLPPAEQACRPGEQVSFHAAARGAGPDYPGEWDQQHASEERIVRWCEVLAEGHPGTEGAKGGNIQQAQRTRMSALRRRGVMPELQGKLL